MRPKRKDEDEAERKTEDELKKKRKLEDAWTNSKWVNSKPMKIHGPDPRLTISGNF